MREAMASSLLENDQNGWNINKVRAMFNPKVAAKIVKITIGSNLRFNKWIWYEEKFEILYKTCLLIHTQSKKIHLRGAS